VSRAHLALVLLPLAALGCAAMTRPAAEPSMLRRDAERAVARGQAALEARRWDAAAGAFGRAATAFSALDDAGAEATARVGEATALRRAARLDAALIAAERAVALDAGRGDAGAEARDLAALAQVRRARGDVAGAIATAEDARRLVDDGSAVAATVENDLATYLLAQRDPADRTRIVALLASAERTNRARGDMRGRAVNQLNAGRAHLAFGEPELAASPLASALEAFRRLDDPEGLAETHEALGTLAASRGRHDERLAHYRQARDTFAFLGDQAAEERLTRRLAEDRP
jgi:tetratricopeptide (TPR) repeat protein